MEEARQSLAVHEDDDKAKKRVTFDDILAELGEFGLEQKINYFLFSLPYILTSMQLMGWVFVGASYPHRCRLPGHDNASFTNYSSQWVAQSCSREMPDFWV